MSAGFDDDDDDADLMQNPFFSLTKNVTIDKYLEKIEMIDENVSITIQSQSDLKTDDVVNIEDDDNQDRVFQYCPMCDKQNQKIDHIKKCSVKFEVLPKDLMKVLRMVPKIKIAKKRSKKIKAKSEQRVEKSNLIYDQYRKILIFDEKFRQELIERNVSKLKTKSNLNDFHNSSDRLPQIWTVSYLLGHCEEYIVEDFRKCFDHQNV
ncbi:hypothetical protein SSS_01462 [Sarcoptes scabiei]|uniref:Uncharacterized protein n=1 Tax=Sarcoptes scabiei TaxID=52283 RepID=A0A834RA60_SARSC|nr:hypothetical protein SSS_01462 [Sarcoptes scabiei]